MINLYCACWLLPVTSPPIEDGAIAIENTRIAEVGTRPALIEKFPESQVHHFGEAAILPGLVNTHSHLELTAMRGFLEKEEADFLAWLKKLTVARLTHMTADDRYISAAWGACEAIRAGVTCVGDASDEARSSMSAIRDVGLRGVVYQESFGPDPRLAAENFEKLKAKLSPLRDLETSLVKSGVSPHAPYTVCAEQLEMISALASETGLPVMMHAAESAAEQMLLREGRGPFAEALASRGIEWKAPGLSSIQYLKRHGILKTRPLLAHCIRVEADDIEILKETDSRIAHCPKSNAKLGHGRAPFGAFVQAGVDIGFGSDSVASNNTCDILEEARFATLISRSDSSEHPGQRTMDANVAFYAATAGGAHAMGLETEIGEIRKGRQADFVVVSLAGTHQNPSYDPIDTLIFTSSGRDVSLTVVAGREVYRNGRLLTVDEERLSARMNEIAVRLRSTA